MAADWFLDLGRQVCPPTCKHLFDGANIEAFTPLFLPFLLTAYLWRRVAEFEVTFTDDFSFRDHLARLFLNCPVLPFSSFIQEKKKQPQKVEQEKDKDYSIHRRCRIS